MSQLTCCPHCHTCFKVAQEQLDAYQGLVRCGQCLQAFNSLIHRVQQEVTPATTDYSSAIQLSGDTSTEHQIDLAAVDTHSSFNQTPTRPQSSPTYYWLTLTLLVLLSIQLVFAWRVTLAQHSPTLNSLLNSSCQLFGCNMPLAQNAELVSIENSQLETDPKQRDIFILHASIKNTAPYVQALPKLALTLNDINETLQARYILNAEQYLSESATLSRLEAGQIIEVELRLRTDELAASGYKLELFY